MNKMIVIVCALALGFTFCAPAQEVSTEGVMLTTLFSDGSTNTWTQADLVSALQLLNRKYHRDVSTASGRAAWHGRKTREVVDTNTLQRITYYEDGTTFTDAARIITPAQSAQAHNAKLPKRTLSTNGVPAALAAARERFAQESGTVSNVTVRVEAGK